MEGKKRLLNDESGKLWRPFSQGERPGLPAVSGQPPLPGLLAAFRDTGLSTDKVKDFATPDETHAAVVWCLKNHELATLERLSRDHSDICFTVRLGELEPASIAELLNSSALSLVPCALSIDYSKIMAAHHLAVSESLHDYLGKKNCQAKSLSVNLGGNNALLLGNALKVNASVVSLAVQGCTALLAIDKLLEGVAQSRVRILNLTGSSLSDIDHQGLADLIVSHQLLDLGLKLQAHALTRAIGAIANTAALARLRKLDFALLPPKPLYEPEPGLVPAPEPLFGPGEHLQLILAAVSLAKSHVVIEHLFLPAEVAVAPPGQPDAKEASFQLAKKLIDAPICQELTIHPCNKGDLTARQLAELDESMVDFSDVETKAASTEVVEAVETPAGTAVADSDDSDSDDEESDDEMDGPRTEGAAAEAAQTEVAGEHAQTDSEETDVETVDEMEDSLDEAPQVQTAQQELSAASARLEKLVADYISKEHIDPYLCV